MIISGLSLETSSLDDELPSELDTEEDEELEDELSSISVNVPKFVVPVTPLIADVPVTTIFPDARGVARVGRTRTFCHARLSTAPFDASVTVNVICVVEIDVMAMLVPSATWLICLLDAAAPLR